MPALDDFAAELLLAQGLTNLDKEVFAQMRRDLVDRLEDRINVAILEHLPKSKLPDFERILDSESPERAQDFVRQNIPHLEALTGEVLVEFRAIYLGLRRQETVAPPKPAQKKAPLWKRFFN